MPNSSDSPLHLFQVLEEEYLSLHGNLSPRETVRLRDRDEDITAELDWGFHAGHVKDAARLAHKLNPRGRTSAAKLAAHLERISEPFREQRAAAGRDALALGRALDELLKVHLYDSDAFKHVTLSDSLRVLLRNNEDAAEDSEGLKRVNRLLLEQTFPNELETISDIRQAAMFQRLHTHASSAGGGPAEYGQAALCLSGGGIRSGTFALGLLQGLARYNLLSKFDYLSTVSGGGYIGSWLTAWLHRHPRELAGVSRDLSGVEPKSKIDPDPPAIQYLREYSNFLTPKSGLFTADTWAFVALYLRNLLLNWLVLFPLLLSLLSLPRLHVALLQSQEGLERWFGPDFPVRYVFLGAGSLLLTLAFTYIILSRPAVSAKIIDRSRFWRGRLGQNDFLRWCLLPLSAAAFCLTTYWAWSIEARKGVETAGKVWWFVSFGVGVTLAAWIAGAFFLGRLSRPRELFGKLELAEMAILTAVGAGGGYLLYSISTAREQDVDMAWYAVSAVPVLLLVILLATILFIGLTSKEILGRSELLNDEDREWWARFNAWVLIATLAWAVFSLLSLHGPRLFLEVKYGAGLLTSVGGLSGVASLLAGFSSKTPANEEKAAAKGGLLRSFARELLLPLLALLFLLAFLVAISLLATFLMHLAAPVVGGLFEASGFAAPAPLRGVQNYAGPFSAQTHMLIVEQARFWFVGLFIIASAALGLVLAYRINLNKFSLHAGYRNRLIRGFLGASRDRGLRRPNPFTGFDPEDNISMHELRPVLFQEGDFDDLESVARKIRDADGDDSLSGRLKSWLKPETREELEACEEESSLSQRLRINLLEDLNTILESELIVPDAEGAAAGGPGLRRVATPSPQNDHSILNKRAVLQREYAAEIRQKYPPPHRLLHVVNTSLNLVGGKKLAWQQRKAEPFVITPLHAGSFRVGYRRSRHYGGARGVSLGTAAAVSGAAASSNMGYYTTSPTLSLVLTLFNVRLGWWLGNPGPAGDKTYRREAPRVSLRPVVEEAFGLTDDTNPYVYLTDGGHFENLALYEMVLRRCRLIVVSDAAEDGAFKFNDLGNAVRKIRIDLGVPIEFDEMKIFSAKPKGEGGGGGDAGKYTYWAFGRIGYSEADKVRGADGTFRPAPDGVLIYIKPTVYNDAEPRDVLQYKAANEDFPHQSTGDQFFDEPQFESYRMLGLYIMNRICANALDASDEQGDSARPSYDLNKSQFVGSALGNYKGNEPKWLRDLIDARGANWLA